MIPYARQFITDDDIDAVVNILKSDWLTQGPTVESFEKSVAEFCGSHYAIATTNATSALHLACLTLGLGRGDYLWTSCNTFVASANCALYCGAKIDLLDINPSTYNICVEALAKKLERAEREKKLPKIIVPVHFAGQSCDMKSIKELSKKYNFFIIEDAAHAMGGRYLDKYIGNGEYSDMTIFSFHPVKLITTGEGGMILTNNVEWANKLKLLRSHGITRDNTQMDKLSDGDWYYQQIELGYNFRMTDIQAALGLSQLQQLKKFIERRRYLANRYFEKLKNLPVLLPYQHVDMTSAWHLFVIQIDRSKDRKYIFNRMKQQGINVNVHYIPLHFHPYYQKLGFKLGDYPVAEEYYRHALSLPLYYHLTDEQQNHIIQIISLILKE